MFTGKEKEILKFTLKEKLKIAKEVTKCVVYEQKKSCKEMEKILENILEKIK